jgi:hypothetical protein
MSDRIGKTIRDRDGWQYTIERMNLGSIPGQVYSVSIRSADQRLTNHRGFQAFDEADAIAQEFIRLNPGGRCIQVPPHWSILPSAA